MKSDSCDKPGIWDLGAGSSTVIKTLHGCLAKVDSGSEFGCLACQGGYTGGHKVSIQCVENTEWPIHTCLEYSHVLV